MFVAAQTLSVPYFLHSLHIARLMNGTANSPTDQRHELQRTLQEEGLRTHWPLQNARSVGQSVTLPSSCGEKCAATQSVRLLRSSMRAASLKGAFAALYKPVINLVPSLSALAVMFLVYLCAQRRGELAARAAALLGDDAEGDHTLGVGSSGGTSDGHQ